MFGGKVKFAYGDFFEATQTLKRFRDVEDALFWNKSEPSSEILWRMQQVWCQSYRWTADVLCEPSKLEQHFPLTRTKQHFMALPKE